MHKLVVILAIAALSTSSASADGGLNLSWDDCGSAGAAAKAFACNMNTGSDLLVASAQIPAEVDSACGFFATIDVHFPNDLQPDWWSIRSRFSDYPKWEPPCRDSLAFVAEDIPSSGTCEPFFPPFGPRGSPYELRYALSYGLSNRTHISVEGFVPYEQVRRTPSHSTEYYLIGLRIDHSKTTGPDACSGCTEQACMVFNKVEFNRGNCGAVSPPAPRIILNAPLTRNYVTWQSETLPNCVNSTPVRRATWGRIRALYR